MQRNRDVSNPGMYQEQIIDAGDLQTNLEQSSIELCTDK